MALIRILGAFAALYALGLAAYLFSLPIAAIVDPGFQSWDPSPLGTAFHLLIVAVVWLTGGYFIVRATRRGMRRDRQIKLDRQRGVSPPNERNR
jgi:hypothetical protein